jgi:8-oxo-dGTP pyrophosphatase MutT (NUDIX family)
VTDSAPAVPGLVRAAGAVVWRRGPAGTEVLLVHRSRYDDWSLPKGKAEPGEEAVATAVREVEEETGVRGVLGPELPTTDYVDHRGRPKVVRYWAMEAPSGTDGTFVANDEVDGVAWLPIAEASDRLSYDRDRRVLEALDGAVGRL